MLLRHYFRTYAYSLHSSQSNVDYTYIRVQYVYLMIFFPSRFASTFSTQWRTISTDGSGRVQRAARTASTVTHSRRVSFSKRIKRSEISDVLMLDFILPNLLHFQFKTWRNEGGRDFTGRANRATEGGARCTNRPNAHQYRVFCQVEETETGGKGKHFISCRVHSMGSQRSVTVSDCNCIRVFSS